MNDLLFTILTPLGFTVRTNRGYWQKIVSKHPDIEDRIDKIKNTLRDPIEVRESSRDEDILLFYGAKEKYWIVVVVRRLNGEGFIITAYRTDAIKEGRRVYGSGQGIL